MAHDDPDRRRYEQERAKIEASDAVTDPDRDAIFAYLDAKDPQTTQPDHTDDSGKSDATLHRHTNTLRRTAELCPVALTDATADDLNQFADALVRGTPDTIKDGGLTHGSVKTWQGAWRKFYEFHDELGVDKTGITLFTNDGTSVDERDLFSAEEIEALRAAASHPRDAALVDMLLYTGQRLSALLNLRVRDIDPDGGVFYLNGDAGQLKGASGKRPLLVAEKAVRDWYNAHPTGDPDDHFLTHKYDWQNKPYAAGERLDNSTAYRQLQRIGDAAGVDKPMNAHNFRHTFVTVAKRNYGMDNDTIKRLIGHRPDSTIMETTYAHLTDDDVIAAAERSVGIRDDEPDSPLTPAACPTCGEPPGATAKACANCGQVFTPDAAAVTDQLQADVKQSYADTHPEDDDTQDKLDALDTLLDDPKVKAALLDRMGD